MLIEEISRVLIKAKRPIDFFGDISQDALKDVYRKYAKIVHPDKVDPNNKNLQQQASYAFTILNELYEKAIKEFEEEIYNIVDTVSLYDKKTPLFSINLGSDTYKFYEHICTGEVANIYKGIRDKDIVYLKVADNPDDNELIDREFDILSSLKHYSIPVVERKLKINDSSSFIMKEQEGLLMPNLLEEYSSNKGLVPEHVMWMLERLFNVVGYLHSNYIVHGNIKPENIIINPMNHNVSLIGYSFAIKDGNKSDAKYQIINEYYTAPEVGKDTIVLPSTDIYSIGKIAIELLGGNIMNNGMPLSVNLEVRNFIRRLVDINVSKRPNDAWKLWGELIDLRNKVYGTERFKKLEKKI